MPKLPERNRKIPDWLSKSLVQNYLETDLEFHPFCTYYFAKLEAAKRDNFPKETERVWFEEFIRRGWTKKVFVARYEALLSKQIYGKENIEISDWINAAEVFTRPEIEIITEKKIDFLIREGQRLTRYDPATLNDKDKKYIALAAARKLKTELQTERNRLIDNLIEEEKDRQKLLLAEKKAKIRNLAEQYKLSIIEKMIEREIIVVEEKGIVIKYLEHYIDLIPDDILP